MRDFYFFLSSFGFGVLVALAFSDIVRHGWRFPYKWNAIILLYMGCSALSYLPSLDKLYYGMHKLYVLQDILTSLLAPLLMTGITRLSHSVKKLTFPNILFIWTPFLCLLFFFHFAPEVKGLLYATYVIMVLCSIYWVNRIWVRVKDYSLSLQDYVTDSKSTDLRWVRIIALFVSVCTIISFGTLVFFSVTSNVVFKPDLIVLVCVYMPVVVTFFSHYSKQDVFSGFDYADVPIGDLSNNLFAMESKIEVMRKERKERQTNRSNLMDGIASAKPRNSILPSKEEISRMAASENVADDPKPELVNERKKQNLFVSKLNPEASSAATQTAFRAVIDEDDPKSMAEYIAKNLAELEKTTLFYLEKSLTVADLAKQLNVSRTALSTYFHDKGTTFFDYIEELRIIYAAQLLERMPDAGLDMIAFKSGFGSRSTFNRSFVNYFHTNPADYRKSRGIG